ncbi:NAD(P)/FAD-dependent oxidoreductase [Streptoalloteichus tenebrarius]|uniref:NAD(P)/FAD-dependent oxidoreductase n=1 Tax=Streptoalloteichus tenebrarius (strain ATCC 17920 / DSM 40477 / JCM 4838 / CBS 697.72 / NBRC 16177 / NCIMB 11028 / NRRL B-12390 / A12253. 1 / ISP 5477) TaxID=1933 RepID=UPI0035EB677B
MRVIVVGAGIVGASAAYHLALEGADVLVVDRAEPGQATAVGAGVVFPWPVGEADPATRALWLAAAEHHPSLLAALSDDGGLPEGGYAQVGGLRVAEDPDALRPAGDELVRLRDHEGWGLGEVDLLDPGEPARLFPGLRPDLAALRVSAVGRVDGRVLRDALLGAAAGPGARRRTASVRLATARGRVTGVEVAGEVHGAHAVVVAAGAWATELCRPLGVDLPVYPMRGQLAHLSLPGVDTDRVPVVLTLGDQCLLGFPGSRIVVGATREPDAGFDRRITAGGLRDVLDEALAVAPGLAGATVGELRVGFRPASADDRPVLGTLPDNPGVVVATGLGRNGLTVGPFVGALAAELALDRRPVLALERFRPDRAVPDQGVPDETGPNARDIGPAR